LLPGPGSRKGPPDIEFFFPIHGQKEKLSLALLLLVLHAKHAGAGPRKGGFPPEGPKGGRGSETVKNRARASHSLESGGTGALPRPNTKIRGAKAISISVCWGTRKSPTTGSCHCFFAMNNGGTVSKTLQKKTSSAPHCTAA